MIVIEKEDDERHSVVRYYMAKTRQIHDEFQVEYSYFTVPYHEFNDNLLIDWLNRELKNV